MIKLRLNEQQFLRTVRLITESTESTAKKRTLEAIRKYFEVDNPRFSSIIRNGHWSLDDMFRDPNDPTRPHPDNKYAESNINYMFRCFEEIFFHPGSALRKSQVLRLEPAIAKIAFENGFQQGNQNSKVMNRLRRIVWKMYYLSKESQDEARFITNLPLDVSFEELNDRYGSIIEQEDADETERINGTEYTQNGYTIEGPIDFRTAQEYGKYTGKPYESFIDNDKDKEIYERKAENAAKKGKEYPSFEDWCKQQAESTKMCYATFKSTWEDYADADLSRGVQLNNVYIALKDGWEDIPPVHDDDGYSAYDTYGLSMIWVIVDENGELQYCNTRWNHAADYAEGRSVDNALTREEISRIVGVNFMQAFKGKNN